MKSSVELKQERLAKYNEGQNILTLAKTEKRELNAEELTRFSAIDDELTTFDANITAAEKREKFEARTTVNVGGNPASTTEKKETDENEWAKIKVCINEAIAQLNNFREVEGLALMKDFEKRLYNINQCLDEISVLDVLRIKTIKTRIRNNIDEVIGKSKIDENRFEQELIYYVEKLDINEEKVRLKTHLDYFIETCRENSAGRKLNFISQEIGREINTIGSKANDAPMQKLVVIMKDELEKIKEQANNVL